jgi:hypothetical protein
MDDPIGIDHEQRPFANPFLASVDSVFARDFSLGFEIGKKCQMITPISGKGDMTPRAIYGNSQQGGIEFRELIPKLTEECEFIPAHRAPIGRIKDQHNRPATKFGKCNSWSGVLGNENSGASVPAFNTSIILYPPIFKLKSYLRFVFR